MRHVLWFLCFCILFTSCREHAHPDALFAKLPSSETGVTFINANDENEDYNVFVYEYFYNGGGVAVGDVNNDGLADIYFSSNQGDNKLYLNKGNLSFDDITLSSGTAASDGWKTGVSMVDINGDGFLDIYVCRSAANEPKYRKNSLFINQGNLTFVDRAAEFGLDIDSYSTQAGFFDYDRDGDLDMFLLNHAVSRVVRNYDIRTESKTDRVPYVGNALFENRGNKFVDVSDSVGVYGPAHNFGLGIAFSDVNNDGWTDVYTSNDYTGSDKLLINHEGKFVESELSLLTHMSRFSMGTDIADVNNDGLSDIYSLDMLPDNNKRQKELLWADNYDIYTEMVRNGLHHQFMRNMLHLNNGVGTFSEIGQLAGISNTDWSWSALFADYDNDGLQDLFVTNGYKRDYTNNDFAKYRADQMAAKQAGKQHDSYVEMLKKMPSTKLHNYLFQNLNGLQFADRSAEWGFDELNLTHGAAYADLDNDGDLDLITNNMDTEAGIYRNNSSEQRRNSFLKIKLSGSGLNTFGVGARLVVYTNGYQQQRELYPVRGFQSSVEPEIFFGLDTLREIDSLVVHWPSGTTQKIVKPIIDGRIVVREQDAAADTPLRVASRRIFVEEPDVIDFVHYENKFVDFKVQTLLTRSYSHEGPAAAVGDVNNDGYDDLYLGGAKGFDGKLFIQNKQGKYLESRLIERPTGDGEDVDAVFFDMDNDGDQDLYVVRGGYEFSATSPELQDVLYRNDNGKLSLMEMPQILTVGSCVRPADVDHDGDLDLFVGSRVVPGRYPEPPPSYILRNDGHGNFALDKELCQVIGETLGMVTDASWADLNNDEFPELLVVGEWMKITVFDNIKGQLKESTAKHFSDSLSGFWNCMLLKDFDNDGDVDLVAGNHGLNNQVKAGFNKPATLLYNDFDDNGSIDPILCYYVGDESFPFPTRDELTEQLPMLKKKFLDYNKYAIARTNGVLSDEQIQRSHMLKANWLETSYFRNDNGFFTHVTLPIQLQFAPVTSLAQIDANNDGYQDLIVGGNLSHVKPRTGMLNGNGCFVFLNDGEGGFNYLPVLQSGINLNLDVKHLIVTGDNVLIVPNAEKLRVFRRQKARN